ncbi:hypothetical protein SF23_03515 [Streptomyces sp. MBRL 10]|nr:hypothetical protein SF23_03515 [Streptomyces sp. MBRL 10]
MLRSRSTTGRGETTMSGKKRSDWPPSTVRASVWRRARARPAAMSGPTSATWTPIWKARPCSRANAASPAAATGPPFLAMRMLNASHAPWATAARASAAVRTDSSSTTGSAPCSRRRASSRHEPLASGSSTYVAPASCRDRV